MCAVRDVSHSDGKNFCTKQFMFIFVVRMVHFCLVCIRFLVLLKPASSEYSRNCSFFYFSIASWFWTGGFCSVFTVNNS